jgi:hypothetical protein
MTYQSTHWTRSTRAVRGIHAHNCHCPRCTPGYGRADPRERRVRTAMFTLAILIGGTLGHLYTPQDIAANLAEVAQ